MRVFEELVRASWKGNKGFRRQGLIGTALAAELEDTKGQCHDEPRRLTPGPLADSEALETSG